MRGEVVLGKGDKLSVREKEVEAVPGKKAADMEVTRKYLEIRSRTAEMLQVATYSTYRALNEKYFGKLMGVVPEGMRAPTIEEVRRFDRTLHEELLRWLSRDVGTLENGLSFYLNDESQGIWRLLDPVVKSLPDQGVEKQQAPRGPEVGKKRKERDSPDREERSPLPRRSQQLPKKTCFVCKKKHWPLCPLPEHPSGRRKQQKEKAKAKKATAAEAKPKAAPGRSEGE